MHAKCAAAPATFFITIFDAELRRSDYDQAGPANQLLDDRVRQEVYS